MDAIFDVMQIIRDALEDYETNQTQDEVTLPSTDFPNVSEMSTEPIDSEVDESFLTIGYFLSFRLIILIPSLIIVLIVMFMEVRKSCCKHCLGGHFAMIIPVNFLENTRDRLVTLSAFAITSLDVLTILLEMDALGPGANPFAKMLIRLLFVLLICFVCLPFLICYTANTYVSLVLGLIYLILYEIVVSIDQSFPEFDSTMENSLDIASSYSHDTMILVYGLVMFIGYFKKIYLKIKKKDKDTEDFYKYQKVYLKRLLINKIKYASEIELVKKGKCVSCWHKHVYSSTPGFRYSLSTLISITVGIIAVTHLYVRYLTGMTQLHIIIRTSIDEHLQGMKNVQLPNILEKLANVIFKDVKFSESFQLTVFDFLHQQTNAIIGSFIAGCVLSYISIWIICLHMLKSYRENVLSLIQRKNEANLMHMKSSTNVTLVASAVQYVGYQVAYIVWGTHLQLFTISVILIVICELIIIPLVYAFGPVIKAIIDNVLSEQILKLLFVIFIGNLHIVPTFLEFSPIIVIIVLTKAVQWLLVKFCFLQERGQVLALDNRKGFFTMMYFMFFYNIFMGLFSCLMRIIKSILFGLLFIPRLDRSILPKTFENFDDGFKSYTCLLKLEAIQTNTIVTTFANTLLRKVLEEEMDRTDTNKTNGQLECNKTVEPLLKVQATRAKNRWLVAYTLIKNPDLIKTRSPKPLNSGENCGEFESIV